MGDRSWSKVGLKSWAVEFGLDPEGNEKASKNSDQRQGVANFAFLKGHSVRGVGGLWRGWGWRQRMMSKEPVSNSQRR